MRLTTKHCPKHIHIPLKPNTYKCLKTLYNNNCTRVILMRDLKTEHLFVVKIYSNIATKKRIEQIENEVEVHGFLDHPHILKLYGAWNTPSHYHLVMEYACNGDLFDVIYRFNNGPNFAYTCFSQLSEAIEYLHQRDIIHCDIKPENVFLTNENNILLGDFGLSINLNRMYKHIKYPSCTPDYEAPELKSNRSLQDMKKIDIWCLGLTVYECIFKSTQTDFNNHISKKIIPAAGTKTLKTILNKDPMMRPDIVDVRKSLFA